MATLYLPKSCGHTIWHMQPSSDLSSMDSTVPRMPGHIHSPSELPPWQRWLVGALADDSSLSILPCSCCLDMTFVALQIFNVTILKIFSWFTTTPPFFARLFGFRSLFHLLVNFVAVRLFNMRLFLFTALVDSFSPGCASAQCLLIRLLLLPWIALSTSPLLFVILHPGFHVRFLHFCIFLMRTCCLQLVWFLSGTSGRILGEWSFHSCNMLSPWIYCNMLSSWISCNMSPHFHWPICCWLNHGKEGGTER